MTMFICKNPKTIIHSTRKPTRNKIKTASFRVSSANCMIISSSDLLLIESKLAQLESQQ